MGVDRGVATRMPQVVWPMMIVTATNFEGASLGSNFGFWVKSLKWLIFSQNPELLPSEALTVTIIISLTT